MGGGGAQIACCLAANAHRYDLSLNGGKKLNNPWGGWQIMRQPNYADNCVLSSSSGGGVSAADKCLSVAAPPARTHLLRTAESCYGSGRFPLPTAELQQQQTGYKQRWERMRTQAGPDIFVLCTAAPVRQ